MSDKESDNKKKYVSYLDEKGEMQDGFFSVISTSDGLITISTGTNRITFPIQRLLKIKEKEEGQ